MRHAIISLLKKLRHPFRPKKLHVDCLMPMAYPNVVRLMYLERMLNRVRNVEGDVVECGVGHGKSIFLLACLLKEEARGRKLWGFDSFEGFPAPTAEDASSRSPKKGEWGDTSVTLINQLMTEGRLDHPFLRATLSLIPGYFQDSLSKYRGNGIALLHIDGDLYESYVTCLEQLYPKVVPGGIVMFDEYLGLEHLKFPGPQKAIDQYFKSATPAIQRDTATGKFFLVKTR